jgi:hypothetical protein
VIAVQKPVMKASADVADDAVDDDGEPGADEDEDEPSQAERTSMATIDPRTRRRMRMGPTLPDTPDRLFPIPSTYLPAQRCSR